MLNEFAWFGSPWWQENWVSIVWIVALVAILAPLFVTPKSKEEKDWENKTVVEKYPFGMVRQHSP